MIDLKNLNIILTGATGGIGGAILDKLYKSNSNIIATGTDNEKLENIKSKYKSKVTVKRFDLSDQSNLENFIDDCSNIFNNKIDVLINNAGITQDNLAIRMKNEEWYKVINLNLTSTFMLTKNIIKKMLKNKSGKIINITSIVGHTGIQANQIMQLQNPD